MATMVRPFAPALTKRLDQIGWEHRVLVGVVAVLPVMLRPYPCAPRGELYDRAAQRGDLYDSAGRRGDLYDSPAPV